MSPLAAIDSPVMHPEEPLLSHLGEVLEHDGPRVRVQTAMGPMNATLATHVPGVVAGQLVVLLCGSALSGASALIVAAYPLDQGQQAPLLDYDGTSRTLTISATRLELSGLDTVTLRCGDVSIRLDVQGELSSQADHILSAALGSHRIEGASVEIN